MTQRPGPPSDVVFGLSFETWDDMVRREFARPPDRLAQYLMTAEDVDRLMVVNPWRSAAGQVRRRLGGGRDAAFPTSEQHSLLRPVRVRRGDSASPGRLARSYRAYDALTRLAARRRGLVDPLLITFNPFYAAHGEHRGFASVTYVARDDWAAYHGTPHLKQAYLDAYRCMRRRGIAVSAVSRELLDRLDPGGPGRVVPNGVDPTVWAQPVAVPDLLADLPRPIAVYTGTIDERLSLVAMASLERAFVGGSVLLIGPQDRAAAARIREAAPSVRLLGMMKQSELAGYVQHADVCVLPHVISDLTRAMSPLKVYEYVAAGPPVVATDLPPVRDVDADVTLVEDLASFGEAARAATATPRRSESLRLQFIADNAWPARCAAIVDLARHQASQLRTVS